MDSSWTPQPHEYQVANRLATVRLCVAKVTLSSSHVPEDLLVVALDSVSGSQFEAFANTLFAALLGDRYVPLGGVSDGGADGLIGSGVYESVKRSGHFTQATTQNDHRDKLRSTAARLREVGRDPKSITLVTSRRIARIDIVEAELSDELGVSMRIRDRTYISAHINDSPATRSAFDQHLRSLTLFLQHIGASTVVPASSHVMTPAVYVFLRQELERRAGDDALPSAVVDALAIWALEGTDPDERRYMTRPEIRDRILGSLPWSEKFLTALLNDRLEALAGKDHPGGRAVRWYKKEDLFCLPYETRVTIEEDNAEDEALRIRVQDAFAERITQHLESGDESVAALGASATIRAVQMAFEREGLEFSRFLEGDYSLDQLGTISDGVPDAFDEVGVPSHIQLDLGEAVLQTLREAFYSSTEDERLYFGKLSRTYALLFTLQVEPRLIDFFQEMTADFYLYVGSDIIIRALSERYLEPADQMTRTTLTMLAEAGTTLVLSEPVLDEVVGHLRATDHEFNNFVAPVESSINIEMARNAGRILIRSYLYARLEPKTSAAPQSWEAYVGQFCDMDVLHKPAALGQVRQYLQAQFNLRFESKDELEKLVSLREVAELAEDLQAIKAVPQLADNDALLTLAIYGRRNALEESAGVTPFGYRTWWLTGESRILRFTKDVVRKHHGDRYMMRPEFVLNFISLSPKAADVRRAFHEIFPSMIGVRLARRMDESVFEQLMEGVDEASELEEGRRLARIASMTDSLKSDFWREYGISFD